MELFKEIYTRITSLLQRIVDKVYKGTEADFA